MSTPAETTAPAAVNNTDQPVDAQANASSNQVEETPAATETAPEPAAQPNVELNLPKSAADGLIQKPFAAPLNETKPETPAQLTPDQQEKYNSVFKTVSDWKEIPSTSAKNAPTAPLTDGERMWLTRECLLRYLRATKWNVPEAVARLQRTVTWRREYGVDKLTPDYISIENETGKQAILGYDIHTRPCLYLMPSNQNTETSDRQVEHLVFMLERVIELMGPDQETCALIVDYRESKSGQNATIGQAKQTLNILQNHYPERLGRALVINVPFMIWGFFKLITPFIDPNTRQKMKFNEDLNKHVPSSQLMKAMGGEAEFRYDHSIYWPAMNAFTEQKRTAYRERWIKGGKLIGEYENYLKTGTSPSLAESGSNGTTDKKPEA